MELLVTQLHDHNKAVSMEALDILDEACEDKVAEDMCSRNSFDLFLPLSSRMLYIFAFLNQYMYI